MSERIPMTRAGYDKIKTELDHLQHVEMPKVLERLATARAEGDLSENAEYHGARESQGLLAAKIAALQNKLSMAMIIESAQFPKDEIGFGTRFRVRDLDLADEEEFTLVGHGEEDFDQGKILVNSPLAQGFLGKKAGQQVEIQVPQGLLRFEILEVHND